MAEDRLHADCRVLPGPVQLGILRKRHGPLPGSQLSCLAAEQDAEAKVSFEDCLFADDAGVGNLRADAPLQQAVRSDAVLRHQHLVGDLQLLFGHADRKPQGIDVRFAGKRRRAAVKLADRPFRRGVQGQLAAQIRADQHLSGIDKAGVDASEPAPVEEGAVLLHGNLLGHGKGQVDVNPVELVVRALRHIQDAGLNASADADRSALHRPIADDDRPEAVDDSGNLRHCLRHGHFRCLLLVEIVVSRLRQVVYTLLVKC